MAGDERNNYEQFNSGFSFLNDRKRLFIVSKRNLFCILSFLKLADLLFPAVDSAGHIALPLNECGLSG